MSVEIYATLGEPHEIAATLSGLRYLVLQGMKGDTGDTGFSPEITSSAIPGGHRIDIYNELGPDSFNVMDGVDGTDGVSPTVTVADITGGHRVTITDATHPQGLSIDVMDGDPGDDYVLTPQDKVEIAGMVPVPTVPTEDISANTAARHTHENKAVLDGITAAKVQSWDGKGTYSKPASGIPASDLASAVQTSLGKADTALQQHQSLAGYATENYVQTQIAAIPDELPATADPDSVLVFDGDDWQAANPAVFLSNNGAVVAQSATVGQIPVKTANGWAAQNIPTELPSVTASDNGKFLRVVSGAWAAASLPSAEGASF